MEDALNQLIGSLESTLNILKGPAYGELQSSLHDHDRLPDSKIFDLAARSVDLLHETELLLEPSSLTLADYFLGHVNSKCLTAAVELAVPDALRDRPLSIEELAEACNARSDRLKQVMRILYNNNIFSYNRETGKYAHNTTSNLLLSDHWTQWRNWVDLYGNEFYDIGRGIPGSLRKGETRMAAQLEYDTDEDMFSYFTRQGWTPRLHKTLSGGAVAQGPGILADYPWSSFSGRTFLDVGGGGGGLVASVLRKHQDVRGGVLDLQEAIEQAKHNFHGKDGNYADVRDQVSPDDLIVGDFLKEIPQYELYTMKWCLHNWDDSKALKIMTNIRRAIVKGPSSRLVIFESLLTDTRSGRLSRYGDITMAITANGMERDEAQWRDLAKQAGWTVNKVYPLRNAWVVAIELLTEPAWLEGKNIEGVEKDLSKRTDSSLLQSLRPKEEALGGDGATEKDSVRVSRSDNPLTAGAIKTKMTFLTSWDRAQGKPFIRSTPEAGFEPTNIKWVEHEVEVLDSRPFRDSFGLDKHGFAYWDDPQSFTPEIRRAIQTASQRDIKLTYYPEIQHLLKGKLGAARVEIFDHTVRKQRRHSDSIFDEPGKEQPATIVHCDQSTKGAIKRLKQVLSSDEEANAALKRGVQVLNVWRPINGSVEDWPLATLDYQTVSLDDIHEVDLLKGRHEERGHTVAVCHRRGQVWYHLSRHQPDEVVVIKIWDSREDVTTKLCAHCAFKNADVGPNVRPRESIEVRCLVMY